MITRPVIKSASPVVSGFRLYLDEVAADTSGAVLDVRDKSLLTGMFISSDIASLHGAIITYVSYDGGENFVLYPFAVPVTRNRSGVFHLDVSPFTHIYLKYDEVAATTGTCILYVSLSSASPVGYNEYRPPITAHLWGTTGAAAILTGAYQVGLLLDVAGYRKGRIVLVPNVATDGGQIDIHIRGATVRGGSLVDITPVYSLGAVAEGAETTSLMQTQALRYEPISDTNEEGIVIPITLEGIAQLQCSFCDSSALPVLTTLEAYVTLF